MYFAIISFKINCFQSRDFFLFYFAYVLLKSNKDKKKIGKSSLIFSLNFYHVLISCANTYGDKNAGSMPFV